MLDTCIVADLKVIHNVMLLYEVTDNLRKSSSLHILVRRKMIRHEANLRIVKYRTANLLKLLDGRRCRNIICHYHIEFCRDKIAGSDAIKPGMTSQDFFGHIHSHRNTPLKKIFLSILP